MSSVPLPLESFPAPPIRILTTPTSTHHPLSPAISPPSPSSNSVNSFQLPTTSFSTPHLYQDHQYGEV
ncbi:hypothetical protein K435DRAFT_781814 [Dendrothele bispora CBS 962.96]|uniref:Uncharacterized protein n=1 Tax=Dendrothele bispora (strain CBS 962.96) TaxID=1314807 RepID=A0A4S8LJH9_DENBC|nr:hypothetical protein K435DRAFT_781814 [Dendrothele bispora CBS 962.96]